MKMVRIGTVVLALASAGCSPGTTASQEPRSIQPAGSYVHRGSGFTFPVSIGQFQRSGITEYNPEASDVSVGYDLLNSATPIAVTVYVYPAPPVTSIGSPQDVIEDARNHLCLGQWEHIKADIVHAHPGANLIEETTITSPSINYRGAGKRAVYRFTGDFEGQQQALQSEAELYCYVGGKWLVAYRTTAPASVSYSRALSALMHSLTWPIAR